MRKGLGGRPMKRHPSHLRGRDIGLWYRDQARQNKRERQTFHHQPADANQQLLRQLNEARHLPLNENIFKSVQAVIHENLPGEAWLFDQQPTSSQRMLRRRWPVVRPDSRLLSSGVSLPVDRDVKPEFRALAVKSGGPLLRTDDCVKFSHDDSPAPEDLTDSAVVFKEEYETGEQTIAKKQCRFNPAEILQYEKVANDVVRGGKLYKAAEASCERPKRRPAAFLEMVDLTAGNQSVDLDLAQNLQQYRQNPRYLALLSERQTLPVYGVREEIVRLVESKPVVVISGDTGSGKTTQIPQIVLDNYISGERGSRCRVVCTQPRRISAISVAERVSAERAEPCGRNYSCGYQIRLQRQLPRSRGSILYCTTGVVLQWLHSNPNLTGISHIFLDEIHERDIHTEFAMIILKDLLKVRSDLHLILMSATLNAQQFSAYFDGCPTFHVPGRAFPVQELYLEDILAMTGFAPQQDRNGNRNGRAQRTLEKAVSQLLRKDQEASTLWEEFQLYVRGLTGYTRATLDALTYCARRQLFMSKKVDLDESMEIDLALAIVQYICQHNEPGGILVFLPGWAQISKLNSLIESSSSFGRCLVIPLHSLMPTANQREVFERPPPGVRKIVLATSIAETSITIDDIVYVVDCGTVKLTGYDETLHMECLKLERVSLANAQQRAGRAGRCQPGVCYHLFSRFQERLLAKQQLPEMLRTSLEHLCLQVKALELGDIAQFLMKAMQPPRDTAVKNSIDHLKYIGALTYQEDITTLGKYLSELAVEPHIGKVLLYGAIFSCTEPIAVIAAALSYRDPFVVPLDREDEVKAIRVQFSQDSNSDHWALYQAFSQWLKIRRNYGKTAAFQFSRRNFLSSSTLEMLDEMRCEFYRMLHQLGFLKDASPHHNETANINSANMELVKSVLVAGLYPKVVTLRRPLFANSRSARFKTKLYTHDDKKVNIHFKSVNSELLNLLNDESDFLVYHKALKTQGVALHDCSQVRPFSLLFFASDVNYTVVDTKGTLITIDGWLKFRCNTDLFAVALSLKKQFDKLVAFKIENPSPPDWSSSGSRESRLLNAALQVLI